MEDNTMTKLIAIFLGLALALSTGVGALGGETAAQPAGETYVIEGAIQEIKDAYFLLQCADQRLLQVNFDKETVFTGLAADSLEAGAQIAVRYDGKMTRSIPAQIFALEVIAAQAELRPLQGCVLEVGADYFLLDTQTHGQVQVNFGAETVFEGVDGHTLAAGQFAVVDFNGTMTFSLPPQVFAQRVGVYAIAGKVAQVSDGQLTLIRQDTGEEVIVTLGDLDVIAAVGDEIIVYTTGVATLSLPAQVNAIGVAAQE